MLSDPSVTILMYFVLPVWFIAGFADWICHRATSIETTSGVKESAIHALMFVEVGLILLPGLFLEINSLVIALAIAIFVIHEATALWDISYAVSERHVSPYEQMVHSFLEIVPLMAIGSVVALHWGQFLATFGYGPDVAGLALEWKHQPLPSWYLSTVMEAIFVFEFIPYAEELLRCWRARPLGLFWPFSHFFSRAKTVPSTRSAAARVRMMVGRERWCGAGVVRPAVLRSDS